jgi:sporulation protein YlmC with PRC-barrel domain
MENLTVDNFTGRNSEGRHPNWPLKYLTASSIIGDKVHDENDEDMGTIRDVMIDISSGKIEYFVIQFGVFLGFGIKYFAIPFRLLRVDPKKKVFVFTQKKQTLENAPGFDLEHWPETNFHKEEDHWSFVS